MSHHHKHNNGKHNHKQAPASAPAQQTTRSAELSSDIKRAIVWCLEWRDYHLANMETELNADHTRTAQEHFDSAERAEYIADCLRKATTAQFNQWYAFYKQTGFAY